MKAQVEEENIHEESTRPISEEDHPAIEPCNPEPENPALPETAETTEEPEDNTDDYEQLKEEYLELLDDTKSQPMKNRKKLPKLKMNKNTKKLIRMVNKIIETTSTDDMNITDINLMQFVGALLITNRVTPAKPTTNRKPGVQGGCQEVLQGIRKEDHQDSKTTRHWRSEEILVEHPGARDQPS